MESKQFTRDVRELLLRIPYGSVVSYGQIAAMAGYPGRARQVAWTLARDSRSLDFPWHRVINSSGKISLRGESEVLQRAKLESEGIVFSKAGVISFRKFGWHG